MPIPIERISVCNLLSFGESPEPLELRPLNVLIGINGSGKSNLIETIALLARMNSKRGMSGYIGQSGGILNWLWKGTEAIPIAKLDVSGGLPDGRHFRHRIAFTRVEQSIEVVDESVARSGSRRSSSTEASLRFREGRSGRQAPWESEISQAPRCQFHPIDPVAGPARGNCQYPESSVSSLPLISDLPNGQYRSCETASANRFVE